MAKRCDCWSFKKGFPTVPIILLVVGILWLLNSLNVITADIPWWPIVLIIIAIGLVVGYYRK